MFDPPKPQQFDGWVCVLERGTELEIHLEANYLKNEGIPVHIHSKRDSAYSLTIGEMSSVYLYVPEEFEEKARELLDSLNSAEEDE